MKTRTMMAAYLVMVMILAGSSALADVEETPEGYFDLATPYRATEYFIDQMPLPDSLRANVMIKYYEAGHMMYVHPPSLVQFREDLARICGHKPVT